MLRLEDEFSYVKLRSSAHLPPETKQSSGKTKTDVRSYLFMTGARNFFLFHMYDVDVDCCEQTEKRRLFSDERKKKKSNLIIAATCCSQLPLDLFFIFFIFSFIYFCSTHHHHHQEPPLTPPEAVGHHNRGENYGDNGPHKRAN